ncbi:MAG: ABC transporter ATP-binding protein, partial [Thiobacillus sp.]
MIRLAAITRVFRMGDQEVRALNAITLDIASGEYVSIMGPSGSGKSTLLNVIGLLDRPDGGRYELDGADVTDLSENERARVRREKIGFVFQAFHLVPRLTAAENIELPLMLEGVNPAERKSRVDA